MFGTILTTVAIGLVFSTAPAQMVPECAPQQAGLAGIGRADVVAFTGAVDGEHVCALVANLSAGAVQARIVDGTPGDALVAASLTAGTGATLVVIRTTPVTVIDLARALRDQPDLFGIDAPERAVVLASGPAAELRLRTDAGTMGADPATPKTLVLIRQP